MSAQGLKLPFLSSGDGTLAMFNSMAEVSNLPDVCWRAGGWGGGGVVLRGYITSLLNVTLMQISKTGI